MEPHLTCIYSASKVASSILDILPDCDLIEELRNLIYIQNELIIHYCGNKHYGTDKLADFLEYTQQIDREIERLKDDIEFYKD